MYMYKCNVCHVCGGEGDLINTCKQALMSQKKNCHITISFFIFKTPVS